MFRWIMFSDTVDTASDVIVWIFCRWWSPASLYANETVGENFVLAADIENISAAQPVLSVHRNKLIYSPTSQRHFGVGICSI